MGSVTGGLRSANDLKLTAPVSGMTVNVASGECIVPGTTSTTQGGYYGLVNSTTNLAVAAADPSKPRVDAVAAVVTDSAYAGGTNTFAVAVVTGTPTTGATLVNLNGAPVLPASALRLGYVLVPAGSTNVTAGNISNLAAVITPIGASASVPASELLQPGDLKWSAVPSAPTGWLLCDGTTYAGGAATYPALAAACPGLVSSGNLTVPDFRGRVPVGPDSGGVHMPVESPSLYGTGGADTTTLSLAQIPTHNHGGTAMLGGIAPITAEGWAAASASLAGGTISGIPYSNASNSGASGVTIPNAGSGTSHTNVQPYVAMNCFIRTGN